MGCATSMSATRSKKFPNTIIITGTKNNISLKGYLEREEGQQFGKSIVMGLIRDKRGRHNSDANLIHVGYLKSNSVYGRPKPSEDDFKFIEQRLTSHELESQYTETTILTDTDSSEKSSVGTRKGRTILIPPARQSTSHSSSHPHWAAVDYQKRFKDIKDVKSPPGQTQLRSEIESAQPRERKQKIVETPRMEIVNHVSREEFIRESSFTPNTSGSTAPPISMVYSQAKNKNIATLQSAQDDISESSFVVAHHTLNVAWETDYQHRPRLNLKWQKNDSDSEGGDTVRQHSKANDVAEIGEIKQLDN